MKLAVGVRKAIKEMRGFERRLAVEPARGFELCERASSRDAQGLVDDLAWTHVESAVLGAEPASERANDLMIRAASFRRIDRLWRELEKLMCACGVDVVVLEEHRRREHNVGKTRGISHELLMHADKQILARESLPNFFLVGRDHHRIGVLDQHRLNWAAPLSASRSPVRISPTRDWSSRRTLASQASRPWIRVLSS